jgi:chemotaxis protein CheD
MKKRQVMVKVARYAVATEGEVLVTLGLGSCVAILMHDAQARVGGMAHVLLPDPSLARLRDNPARFATTAVPLLIEEMVSAGAARERLTAKLVGGASMFAALMMAGHINMGERNLAASRRALKAAGIPLAAEAGGGGSGRSVRFSSDSGRVVISSALSEDVEL